MKITTTIALAAVLFASLGAGSALAACDCEASLATSIAETGDWVEGNDYAVHRFRAYEGNYYTLVLAGYGRADLDVSVKDRDGVELGTGAGPKGYESFSFAIPCDGEYTVTVKNLTTSAVQYDLDLN